MTKENKQLLLKDLCTRLPYKVKTNITYNKEHGSSVRLKICSEGLLTLNTDLVGLYIEDEIYLKPYLRPMSSMTNEEKEEYQAFFNYDGVEYPEEYIDWLNAHHFDYRGLIDKGIALQAPEGMYDIK